MSKKEVPMHVVSHVAKAGPRPLHLLAASLVLAFSAQASAQSLKELYEIARSYDAGYLGAQAQTDSVTHKVAQSDALFRPTVGLNAGVSRTQSDTPARGATSLNTQSVGISASQPLFNRGNSLTSDKAYKLLDVAKADLDSAEQDLIVRLSQAYFDVLTAQEVLNTAQASQKGISEQLASAKRNFEVGSATITDTREAQARFDLATAQVLAADNDLRTKRLALDQLVGKTNIQPKPLAQPVVLPALVGNDVDPWTAHVEESAMVRKARAGYEVAQFETRRTESGHLPTLSLDASASSAHNTSSNGGSLFSGGDGTSTSAKIGLTLNVPLYAGNAITNQAREAVGLEEKSRNDLETARRAVTQGVRQAYFGVQSGLAQVKALEAAESSSKLALEATQLGYKVGVRVNLDVLNAQTQLYSTQRDLSKARNDVLVASLKLRQVAGTLTPADLNQINALIAP
jgi:outer membrane protein